MGSLLGIVHSTYIEVTNCYAVPQEKGEKGEEVRNIQYYSSEEAKMLNWNAIYFCELSSQKISLMWSTIALCTITILLSILKKVL